MKHLFNEKFLVQKNEILLGVALVLFIFSIIMEMTAFSITESGNDSEIFMTITKAMRYLAYALCILQILMDQKVNASWILYVALAAGILSVVMMVAGSRTMFMHFWILAACTGISDKKILRTIMCVQTAILCFTVLMSQIGVVQDFIETGDRIRHYLGFTWTTYAPILFFYIVLQYLYICDMQLTFLKFIILMIVNIWFFVMTNTRFVFILLTVTLVGSLFYHYTSVKKLRLERLKYLFILSPEIIALFSVGLHVLYDSGSTVWNSLNNALSGRLQLGYDAFHEYGITLFGQDITWYGNGLRSQVESNGITYNYVDCSYLQFLLQYGLIFLILVLVAFSVILWKAIKEKRYSACWVVLMVLIFGITEPWLLNIGFNPFIMLIFTKAEQDSDSGGDIRQSVGPVLVINRGNNRESLDA